MILPLDKQAADQGANITRTILYSLLRVYGIQWTPWTQFKDLDSAVDLALISYNQQQLQEKDQQGVQDIST